MDVIKAQKSRSGSLIALLVLGVVFAGAAIYFLMPGPVHTIRLGAYEGDVGALEWIAKDKGFFDQVRLNVDIKGYPSGDAAVKAMHAGEVDIATAAELVVAKRSFDEKNLRILAGICRYWNKGFIGRKDHGITTHFDLKGKKIAFPATSSAEHNLVVFLALQGLTLEDVEPVNLAPKQIVEKTISGEVDAALVWEPHVSAIEDALGDNAVKLMERGTEANLLLVGRQEHLDAQSQAIQKLLKGLILAEDWVRANPEEAKAYLVKRFALDAIYIDKLWPRMQLAVSLPQEILEAMDSVSRWIAKANNKEQIPNYAETIRAAELRAVKPAAVGVFTK
ncbi:MAG: NrtA/SsuA/CpmA family ABC transporter substrate-binding protein [Alphaproteobacteria bacterium]|nr:NrtA/SsuA/CpmA family ABC transporter substrate-binding protein [Alphaproteobacteria bacterium]